MAAYSSPDIPTVLRYARIKAGALGLDDETLETLLPDLLPVAEANVALAVGEEDFDRSDLTARQVVKLQYAVALEVWKIVLLQVYAGVLDGTHEALLVADPDAFHRLLTSLGTAGSGLNFQADAAATVGDGSGSATAGPLTSGEFTGGAFLSFADADDVEGEA